MGGEPARAGPADRASDFERLAFEQLDALYRTAKQMTRNRADAEDLVQDACLRACRFFHRFQAGTNFRGWIFRILRNTYINQYHRRRRRPETVGLDGVDPSAGERSRGDATSARERTSGSAFGKTIMVERLERALAELPDNSRTALLLAYVEGFSYREVAAIMRWPIGTVMSRLHRTRKTLRKRIEDRAAHDCERQTTVDMMRRRRRTREHDRSSVVNLPRSPQ